MKEQLNVARYGLITEDTFKPIKNYPRIMLKPAMTGIWTSTYDPSQEYMSDWIRYSMNELNSSMCGVKHVQILKPKKEARVLEVNLDVLENIIYKKYMMEPVIFKNNFLGDDWNALAQEIDYEKLAQDYDAIHYVPGCLMSDDWMKILDIRFNNPFTAWDCESTLWFRWMFEDDIIIKKINFPAYKEEFDWDEWEEE